MEIIIIGVIIFLSLLLGVFGFSQIVGTLKFFRNFRLGSAIFTIVFWAVILGFGAFAIINWLNDYAVALYIGYGVAFLLSLGTKPDTPIQANTTNTIIEEKNNLISDEDCDIDTSFMFEEDKQAIESINKAISIMIDTYNNAIRDLSDYTMEDAYNAYKNGFMTKSRYNELKNAIQNLTFVKETYPIRISEMKEKRKEILVRYK